MDTFEVEVNEDEYIVVKEHEAERSNELDILTFGLCSDLPITAVRWVSLDECKKIFNSKQKKDCLWQKIK